MTNCETNIVVSVRNVGIYYPRNRKAFWRREGGSWALRDVSFDIHSGKTIGIIGNNGSGKSTLLRSLAGIIAPDQGAILNFGVHVSLVSLSLGFIEGISGRENAILSGMLHGATRTQMETRIPAIKGYTELGDKFDQPLFTYSSGMKARLGFAVALHVESDVILMDEILSVGDISFREKSSKSIREMINSNRTVVLVSHNMESIKELCDYAVWIEQGVTQAFGDPEDIIKMYSEHESRKS